MAALQLDIKVSNPLEQSAIKTAVALEHVATVEKKVNALAEKELATYELTASAQKRMSDMAKRTSLPTAKAMGDMARKDYSNKTHANTEAKKGIGIAQKLANNYLLVRDAVMVAWRAAKAMTLDLISGGRKTAKELAAIKYELNQWSGSKGAEQFIEIEKFAKSANISVAEASKQWLKFRQASTNTRVVSNQEALDLVKVWADIRAISQSTEQADKQMDEYIQKIGEGPAVAASFLKQLQETTKYGVVGTGEIAKNLRNTGQGADDAFENSVTRLEKLFNDKFGGVVDKIKNTLASAIDKLASSKTFHSVLDKMRDAAMWLIEKGIPLLIDGIGKFVEAWNKAGDEIQKTGTDWFSKISDSAEKLLKFFNPAELVRDFQSGPNGKRSEDKTQGRRESEKATPAEQRRPEPITPTQTSPAQPATPIIVQPPPSGGPPGKKTASITIQNLNVNGGGDADQIARSVKQELHNLLQAGALSRGLA